MALSLVPQIAVIDDDDTFLNLVHDVFVGAGYTVVAHHPTDAFALFRDWSPHLLILDLAFATTRIAGLALLRTVRREPHFAHFPVLVVAAATDLLTTYETEFAARDAHTLAKPFALARFLREVEHLLHMQ